MSMGGSKLNSEIARRYILNALQIKEGHTIKQHFLRSGSFSAFMIIFFLLTLWLVDVTNNTDSIAVTLILFLLLLSMPFIIILTIIFSRQSALKLTSIGVAPKNNLAMTAFGTIGAAIGFSIHRMLSANAPDVGEIVFIIISIVIIILFTFLSTISFYSLYLLLKYCPEQANEKDVEALRKQINK